MQRSYTQCSNLQYTVLIIFPGLKSKDAKAPCGKEDVKAQNQFSDKIATADVYVTSKARPSKVVMETTAKALKPDERLVRESR